MIYILLGVISPYDGSYILGAFGSLEDARKARSDYRRAFFEKHRCDDFESYPIYERKLGEIHDNYALETPIDDFVANQHQKGRF